MQGIVNRQTKSHVGVLVYDAFNVSIPRPDDDEEWLGNSIQIGSEVLFRITFIDLSSHLPYIRGELIKVVAHIDEDISLPSEKAGKFKGSNKTLLDESVTDGSSINKIPKRRNTIVQVTNLIPMKTPSKQKKELSFNSETEDEITVSFNKHTELRQSKKKNKHKNEPETPAETPKKKKK
ncbi:hypothetical protein NQ317_002562 [Molorchus minor]|uniref:RPA43 OB domain-containing protein n=1 Tax=Molorchus minor TaxID=1323400 RepID=A0ABQ9IS16_9CUCU|nr:hypothetical protein NQ317_002562 [Molorchus minor]